MLKLHPSISQWYAKAAKWKILLIISFILLFLLFSGTYLLNRKTQSESAPHKIVEVEILEKRPFRETIRLLGTLHPKHTTIMVAKGSGTLDVLIPTGRYVKKGDLIATIDNPDLEKNFQLSLHNESMTKTQFERLGPLLKKGYISSAEIEEKKKNWIEAQKSVSAAKIALDNQRFYAPFDGIVGAWKKREGTEINQGDTIVVVYDPGTLIVDFDIPCSNLAGLNHDQSAYVLGKRYKLSSYQKMLDEETHMCPAGIEINCDDCLMGTTVDVDLVLAEKDHAISIPFQALFLKKSNPFVYIVKEGKIALIAVKTGLKQQDRIEILEGLKPGEQLVIKGQERLFPEMPVSIYKPDANNISG